MRKHPFPWLLLAGFVCHGVAIAAAADVEKDRSAGNVKENGDPASKPAMFRPDLSAAEPVVQ